MKKILVTTGIAFVAMIMLSCNRKAEFTSLSFVYFESNNKTVYESDGIIEIPVYASADAEFTVTFTTVDGEKTDASTGLTVPNGQKGVDYSIVDNDAAILAYPYGTEKQVIKVQIVDFPGVLTGNKEFSLKLQSAGNEVSLGGFSTCKVTIIDNDHPLKEIFGEYAATDKDGVAWTMTFAEDPNSYTQILIDGIIPTVAGNWVGKGLRHYVEAPVTADLKKISIPLGYTFPDTLNDNDVQVFGYDGSYIYGSGTLTFEKTDDGYKLDGDRGFAGIYSSGGSYYLAGSNAIVLAPITLVKK